MDCPNCGTYNPEGRTQCWKCDEELPSKPPPTKKRGEPGKMGVWTWIIIVILGAIWILRGCALPQQTQPSSMQPPAVAQPLT